MSLKFVLDEHLRGMLLEAVEGYTRHAEIEIDVVCVGDDPSLPLGSDDSQILAWAEQQERIVITRDRSTMPARLQSHLKAGHASPGVLILRRRTTLPAILEHLALINEAGDPQEYADQHHWFP